MLLDLLQILALGLILAVALTTWYTMRRFRRPPRRTYAAAIARNLPGDPSELDDPRPFTPFDFVSGNHRCAAWDIPGDDGAGPMVVCTPGWGDSKIGLLPRLAPMLPHASRIIVWDPPGLGETPGLWPMGTREPLMLLDLVRDLAPDGRPVVLMGWSAGAGSSIAAAARDDANAPTIDAVIAEAPYRFPWVPAFAVMRNSSLPWRINGPFAFALLGLRLMRDPLWRGFDRAALATRVRCPILLIHAVDDDICPFADSQAIASSASDATLVPIAGATHNNLWTEEPCRTDCIAAVADFLGRVRPADAAPDRTSPWRPVPPGIH